MKNYYNITFKWNNSETFCTNIACAENAESVKKHYAKYEIITISIASEYDIKDAQRRGKPITVC